MTAIGAVAEYAEISDNLVDILYFTQFQISKVDDPYVDDIELPGLNSCLDMSTNKVLGQYEQYEFGCSEFDTEPCNWKEQVLAAQSFLTDTPAGQRIVKKNQIDGAVYMVYDREKNIDAELLPFLQEKDQIEPLFDSVKSDVDPSMIPRVLSVNEAAPEGLEYQRHVVTIPWTSFYDQDAAEGLLRYEKTYSDNCAEAPQM